MLVFGKIYGLGINPFVWHNLCYLIYAVTKNDQYLRLHRKAGLFLSRLDCKGPEKSVVPAACISEHGNSECWERPTLLGMVT
jgi:hypothetical protein